LVLGVKESILTRISHFILTPHDKIGIVSITGNFEMEHTILRNNAQYKFWDICALLRNVWGWEQVKITPEKDILEVIKLNCVTVPQMILKQSLGKLFSQNFYEIRLYFIDFAYQIVWVVKIPFFMEKPVKQF